MTEVQWHEVPERMDAGWMSMTYIGVSKTKEQLGLR